jgi:hypothetical protein
VLSKMLRSSPLPLVQVHSAGKRRLARRGWPSVADPGVPVMTLQVEQSCGLVEISFVDIQTAETSGAKSADRAGLGALGSCRGRQ